MSEPQNNHLIIFVKRNFIFILLLLSVLFLEVNITNYPFFVTKFQNLQAYQYTVDDGVLYGFEEVDGQLISEHNDPHITLRQIDDRIRYITIRCTNPNPDALSQVFYRREDEDWHEENSITFSLSTPETTLSLPTTTQIASLRLDLTNREGDTLTCQGFTLNPKSTFTLSIPSITLLIMAMLGFFFGHKFFPDALADSLWRVLIDGHWIYILFIILINLAYPVMITFDSAHYLWLADLIKTGDWALWDPIRYLGFPLFIFIALTIMGYSQPALLYPMIFAHILLFIFSCQIVFDVFKVNKRKHRFAISSFIFFFIAMDTTVFGYYHILLTEFLVATIAVISCSLAIKLYQTPLFSKKFYLFSSCYFFLVPIAWHIKQPYIGAAFFPLLTVSLLIFFRQRSLRTFLYALGMSLTVALLVILSTVAWNQFLQNQGNPMPQSRQLDILLEDRLNDQVEVTRADPKQFLIIKMDEYLTISNYYLFNFNTLSIIKNPMLGRGNENTMIAHRMVIKLGQPNLYFKSPELKPYTRFLETTVNPPTWLNNLFLFRSQWSHILFTLTNLALPIFVLLALFLWIKEKSILYTSLLILSTSSLMNLMAHIMVYYPNDRYQFWGYILNLLVIAIAVIHIIKVLLETIKRKHNPFSGR